MTSCYAWSWNYIILLLLYSFHGRGTYILELFFYRPLATFFSMPSGYTSCDDISTEDYAWNWNFLFRYWHNLSSQQEHIFLNHFFPDLWLHFSLCLIDIVLPVMPGAEITLSCSYYILSVEQGHIFLNYFFTGLWQHFSLCLLDILPVTIFPAKKKMNFLWLDLNSWKEQEMEIKLIFVFWIKKESGPQNPLLSLSAVVSVAADLNLSTNPPKKNNNNLNWNKIFALFL